MEGMVVSKYPDIVEVRQVEPLANFSARVTFTDGSQRVIDLEPYLFGPVFEPIHNDSQLFRRVFVDHGALTWPNGADIDTDTLYYDGPPPWAQEQADPSAHMRHTGQAPHLTSGCESPKTQFNHEGWQFSQAQKGMSVVYAALATTSCCWDSSE